MIIVGAKGLAKEILEILHELRRLSDLFFYDDVSDNIGEELYGRFPVLRSPEAAQRVLKDVSPAFTLGLGGPALRAKMARKFCSLGGNLVSTVSPLVHVVRTALPLCRVATSCPAP